MGRGKGGSARRAAWWLPLALAALVPLTAAPARAAAPLGAITEYGGALPAGEVLERITSGPDGAMWFADPRGLPSIDRIEPGGGVTRFTAGLDPGAQPYGIVTGPEGDLWFTDRGSPSAIGRLVPGGTIEEFSAGLGSQSYPWSDIAEGADGNLWFANWSGLSIGRVTPQGQITEVPDNLGVKTLAADPQGNLWIVNAVPPFTGSVTRMTPGGESTTFHTGMAEGAYPLAIAAGSDGNMWFADDGPVKAIGRITPSGQITEFSAGLGEKSWILGLAPGPDGAMWFGDSGQKAIGRITPDGHITEYPIPASGEFGADSVAPGADGEVWFTGDDANGPALLGEIGTGAPAALAGAPELSGAAGVGSPMWCAAASWNAFAGEEPSSSLFAYDGFRWLRDGVAVGAGQGYTPVAADAGHRLACRETVTYPAPLLVTAAGESSSVGVPAPPTPRPALSGVRESSSRWREGSALAAVSARRPPVGTTFSFTLNEQARLRLVFTRLVIGRRSAHGCIGTTRPPAARLRCTRRLAAGELAPEGAPGPERVSFQGRISRSRRLSPGSYEVRLSALAGNLSSVPHELYFAIVR
jgi:streptogramin lyase